MEYTDKKISLKKNFLSNSQDMAFQGNYYSFYPTLIPGLLFICVANSGGDSFSILKCGVILLYGVLALFLRLIRPVLTIGKNEICIKWFFGKHTLPVEKIKEIVVQSRTSIHVNKNHSKWPLQISVTFGFKPKVLYPKLKEFAKENNISLVEKYRI